MFCINPVTCWAHRTLPDNGLSALRDLGANVTALAIDPSNSNLLYAGTSGGGVFRSTDAGVSWRRFNDGLTNLNVSSLVIAPGSTHTLYVGTSGGVFRITDDARPAATGPGGR